MLTYNIRIHVDRDRAASSNSEGTWELGCSSGNMQRNQEVASYLLMELESPHTWKGHEPGSLMREGAGWNFQPLQGAKVLTNTLGSGSCEIHFLE